MLVFEQINANKMIYSNTVLLSKYFMHWLTTVRREIMVDSESAMPSATLDPKVAALSPRGSPLVLHDPEVLTSFGAVADRRHCVVVSVLTVGICCLLTALWVVEDAVAVVKQVVSLQEQQCDLKEANLKGRY